MVKGLSASIRKIKMLTSVWSKNNDFVDTLLKGSKFIQLDILELQKPENKHIIDWLSKLTETQRGVFVFFAGSEKKDDGVEKFFEENRLTGCKIHGAVKAGLTASNTITLLDLNGLTPDAGEDIYSDRNSLYLPYIYSVSGIYLAAQVVIAGGDIAGIQDNLIKTTLKKTYESLFGEELNDDELNQLFRGKWPKAYKIVESINALRKAIAQIEAAA